jgi:hypothetical protein
VIIRPRALLVAVACLVATLSTARAKAEEPGDVDLQLVLALDSSSSVNMDEFYLQAEGYAAAFRHPQLHQALRSGPHQAIAVMVMEWSSANRQQVNFAWRVIHNEAEAASFAEELEAAPRLVTGGETAIGDAIAFALTQLDPPGISGGRRVIDISGDGPSNRGRPLDQVRDEARFLGVTINGLAILNEVPWLDLYYQTDVVTGPGAFVLSARDYSDFKEAILRKLVREITVIALRNASAK